VAIGGLIQKSAETPIETGLSQLTRILLLDFVLYVLCKQVLVSK
jgi:hypothetical protein